MSSQVQGLGVGGRHEAFEVLFRDGADRVDVRGRAVVLCVVAAQRLRGRISGVSRYRKESQRIIYSPLMSAAEQSRFVK